MLIVDQLTKNDATLRVLTWSLLLGTGILLVGLYHVQVVSSRHFVADQRNQSFRTVRIPAIRGKILDRHRRALADNRPSYNVCLYLEEMRDKFTHHYTNEVLPAYRQAHPNIKRIPRKDLTELKRQARYEAASNVVHSVGRTLQEELLLEPETFHRHYQNTLALPLTLIPDLNHTQLARFQESPVPALGVDLEVQPNRVYPHGTLAAHLLGHLTRDTRSTVGEESFVNYRLLDYSGRIGLEWAFDEQLRGRGGVKSVLVNSLGYRQSETVWTPAEPGKNIILTIDLTLQQETEKALRSAGPEPRGAVVIMDPNSGDILALASAPTFDPNLFIPFITHADYRPLMDEDRKPMRNRAIQENYHPGSIFKTVTGLACLEAGIDPKQRIYNPGHIYVGRRRIDDLAKAGEYDFERAFAKSSNTYFISNGMAAGIERIIQIGQELHLGEVTGLPTGQEVPGNFPDAERLRRGWSPGDTANLCIGQGPIDMTPLQTAVMISAIANGGKVLWPRLVMGIEPQDSVEGQNPIYFPSGRVRNLLSVHPRSLELTRKAMLADVEDPEGTGIHAGVVGLRICGKTGTAEITDERGHIKDKTTWFASYAPFESPRYVVVVMVESGASGGGTCAPVARKVYQAIQRLELEREPNHTIAQAR